jgi:DNA-binding transcriptional regulator YiaG
MKVTLVRTCGPLIHPQQSTVISDIELNDLLLPASARATGVILPARAKLCDSLANAIVKKRTPLSGPEVRFLRKQLKIRSRDFARALHITPQHFSAWENGHKMPSLTVDLIARLMYVFLASDQSLLHQIKSGFVEWTLSVRPIRRDQKIVAEYLRDGTWLVKFSTAQRS